MFLNLALILDGQLDFRVELRRLSSLPLSRMFLCLLLVSTRRNTHQIMTLFLMLAAPPTTFLLWKRFLDSDLLSIYDYIYLNMYL